MPNDTPTIDCQVHAYDRNNEDNYRSVLAGPATVTGEEMVAAMDAVGVDGALLISPFTIYGYDSSYCEGVAERYPDRFGLIAPFDPNSPGVGAEVEAWAERPGVVGARVVLNFESVGADHAGVDAIMSAGGAAGIPINVLCWQNLPELRAYAQRHPDTQLVNRSRRSATALPASAARRSVGRHRSSDRTGGVRACGDQDFGRLHAVARAVSLPGYLGTLGQAV